MMFSIVSLTDARAQRIAPCPVKRGSETATEGQTCPGCGATAEAAPSFMRDPLMLVHRGWSGHPDRADVLDFQHPDGVIVRDPEGSWATFRLARIARDEVEAARKGLFTAQTGRLFLIRDLPDGWYPRCNGGYSGLRKEAGMFTYRYLPTAPRGSVGELWPIRADYRTLEGEAALERAAERLHRAPKARVTAAFAAGRSSW